MPVIDILALEKMTGGDADLLADVAVMFAKTLPDMEARIRFGIENHRFDEVESVIHQLRSRVGYFGAKALQTSASQLESAAREGELNDVERLTHEVFVGVRQLLDELREITKLSLEVAEE